MSDHHSTRHLNDYIAKLLEQATPNPNDIRQGEYVDYINAFLSYFGEERVHLVGSTAEQTKLRTSTDNSDVDFLLISGRLTIPVSEIEIKSDVPSFVWIRGENLDVAKKLGIEMIEARSGERYLPADIVIELDPRLFTILRGIYRIVTSTTDGIPARQTRVTTLGEQSNVGLARTELRGLEIKDKHKIPQLRKYFPKRLPPRASHGMRRNSDEDRESVNKILKYLTLFSVPGNPTEHEGQFAHFTDIVNLLLARQKKETLISRGEEPVLSFGSDDTELANNIEDPVEEDNIEIERFKNNFDLPTDVTATYKGKSMKDFVPALKITGRLECMNKWSRENGKWLSDQVKEKIENSELYIIAKSAPVNPDKRDFCLAFSHAEVLLTKSLTQPQRKCLLIMKAFHKGVFERIIKPLETTHKLKSFHIKTALYWLLEETADSPLWTEDDLVNAVRRVLLYLRKALEKKRLIHYFAGSNLFIGFEDDLCKALICGIDHITANPVKALKDFFDVQKESVMEIVLTDEQVKHLIRMSKDGGAETEVNTLESAALDDFQRGFTETRAKKDGYLPLTEAVNYTWKMFLRSEAEKKAREELKKLKIPAPDNLDCLIAGLFGSQIKPSFRPQLSVSQSPKDQNRTNAGNVPRNAADQPRQENFDKASKHSNPVVSQKWEKELSNRPIEANTDIELIYSRKLFITQNHGKQLADATHAFFSCSANNEQRQMYAGQVKQLGLSFFLGKDERDTPIANKTVLKK